MSDKTLPVRKMIEAWDRLDVEMLAAQFAEDAVFENIPMDLIVGREAIRAAITTVMDEIVAAPWTLRNICVTDSGTVMTERVDVFHHRDGRRLAIEVMGAFDVNDDNLITHWRDYFDLADWNRQDGKGSDFGRRARP